MPTCHLATFELFVDMLNNLFVCAVLNKNDISSILFVKKGYYLCVIKKNVRCVLEKIKKKLNPPMQL